MKPKCYPYAIAAGFAIPTGVGFYLIVTQIGITGDEIRDFLIGSFWWSLLLISFGAFLALWAHFLYTLQRYQLSCLGIFLLIVGTGLLLIADVELFLWASDRAMSGLAYHPPSTF